MEPSVYAELVPPYIANLQTYQSGKTIAEVQRSFGLDRVIKLASNENPWGPSPKALQAVRDHLAEIHRYPDQAALDLRSALAQRYQLSNDNIIVAYKVNGNPLPDEYYPLRLVGSDLDKKEMAGLIAEIKVGVEPIAESELAATAPAVATVSEADATFSVIGAVN